MLLLELFWVFFRIGAFSFGGGYAMIPFLYHELVTTHAWLSHHEMTDVITVSQMTPGPVAINAATLVGYRLAGVLGSAIATGAVILPATLILLVVARYFWARYQAEGVQAVFRGIRPVAVALVASAAVTLAVGAVVDWITAVLLVAAGLASFYRVHPVVAIVACGLVGVLVYG
ncbi:MAG: chromate transporter [Clostridia bacterium]|nr:MAG: chromate transporter [Clostridia bacterium]